MKTVTIPTCANPFVVIVNGQKYIYPAGATMEVPDDVAEVIEQHEEAKTEPAPVAPPFVAAPSTESGGGGLPVVELTTVLSAEIAQLTETESAQIEAIAEKNTPITVKFIFDGATIVASLNKMSVSVEGGTLVLYSGYVLIDYTPYIVSLIYEGTWFGEIVPVTGEA